MWTLLGNLDTIAGQWLTRHVGLVRFVPTLTLRHKIAEQPFIVGSLGPTALKDESLEPQGKPYILDPKTD